MLHNDYYALLDAPCDAEWQYHNGNAWVDDTGFTITAGACSATCMFYTMYNNIGYY